jgi:pyrimidine deaminase RibD-like protein
MSDIDLELMKQAILWASRCSPVSEAIPKVGAIIAVGSEVIGHGRRGTGDSGDDQHAEWHALKQVAIETQLTEATLYTTLEPCTGEVRTRANESCTELILQHRIPRVVIGMLDPNQGVTGKGLWRLQDTGVDVSLFPHDLANKVRTLNAPFIRFQQTLGATIIAPEPGAKLRGIGQHPIRLKCVNPPADRHVLLCMKDGLCWPQSTTFSEVNGYWEGMTNFGLTGVHTLHLVTASDLGMTLIDYHRRVIARNGERKKELASILGKGHSLPGEGRWPGIPMAALPKGLRSEASVTVTIV